MKTIDKNFDDVLGVNYTLYSLKLSKLKELAKSWYDDIDLSAYDNSGDDKLSVVEMKLSGLVSNYFYAYEENGKFYLLDGFNRLFTDYSELTVDPIVYIKIIHSKCSEDKLMTIMFRLNMWKLRVTRLNGLDTQDFLDRGFRLFLKKKFNINIYRYVNYLDRTKNESDFKVLDFYFKNEKKIAYYWSFKFKDIIKLFTHKNVVNDFRQMVEINDYLELPFNNYPTFVKGFIMFLAWRRVNGDDNKYDFNHYLELLKKDKFYKKLIKMSGTDSTRINVYNFFRKVHNDNLK